MQRIEVHKFGGTSVGSAERMRGASRLVARASRDARCCVVTSAVGGVTDLLVGAARVEAGDDALEQIRAVHHAIIDDLKLPENDPAIPTVHALLDELASLAQASRVVGAIPGIVHDRLLSGGERMSAQLLAAAMRTEGLDAVAIPASELIETSDAYTESDPLSFTSNAGIRSRLLRELNAGRVPVVTGFFGRGPDGTIRLLGRGGSDLSASLIAGGIGADELIIWTDVAGVRTADPRVVPDTDAIDHLHYREAGEMAYFGSKVLHPRTMVPVVGPRIPISVRSSLEPDAPATRIDAQQTDTESSAFSVSILRDAALVSIEGAGLVGVAGTARRVFEALHDENISVVMISQGSSESSICVCIRDADALRAETALRRAFHIELARGTVEDIASRRRVAVLTAIGAGMRHHVGAAATMTGALARSGVNILAISQGSSELSVSFAVHTDDVRRGARALHESMRGLGRDEPSRLDLIIAGLGQIGASVCDAAIAGLPGCRVVALCDSSGYVFASQGIEPDALHDTLDAKRSGARLADQDHGVAGSLGELIERAREEALPNPVLIDCTVGDATVAPIGAALRHGFGVVTANKEVLGAPHNVYQQLRAAERNGSGALLGEATVGAGLPVEREIDVLRASGDRITAIEASLSGTLSHMLAQLETDDTPLPRIIEQAIELGYAEPDPTEDLTGADLVRKAVILARLAGFAEREPHIEPFLTPEIASDRARWDEADQVIRRRQAEARDRQRSLRYLIRVSAEGVRIGYVESDLQGPFGALPAGHSRIAITTERHAETPLVISGAGAGAASTTSALLADLARLRTMLFGRENHR